jgi:hypothetical protein
VPGSPSSSAYGSRSLLRSASSDYYSPVPSKTPVPLSKAHTPDDQSPAPRRIPSSIADSADKAEESPSRSYPEDETCSPGVSSLSVVDKLSVLPDELVCIGLNHQYEGLWREKVVKALFFCEDVLSASSGTATTFPPPQTTPFHDRLARVPRPKDLYSIDTSTASPSPDRPRPQRLESYTAGSDDAFPPVPDGPTPFFSLTQTSEGTSLTSDIRILRRLFPSDEEGQNIVYAAGGGLWGLWRGEEDDSSPTLGPEAESDRVKSRMEREIAERGRARTRRPRGQEEEEWEKIEASADEWDTGRKLLKCIQLDLSSSGLGKRSQLHGSTEPGNC